MSDAAAAAQARDAERVLVTNKREAWTACVALPVATAVVMTWAFSIDRAGRPEMLAAIFGLDLAAAVVALRLLRRHGELGRRLRVVRGDIWLGCMVAGVLYGAAMLAHLVLTPHMSPREGWIERVYQQIGDPNGEGREVVGVAVLFVAALEEIAWRGLVMQALERVTRPVTALVVSSALFALAHVPTMLGLSVAGVGPNPLLVIAGFGCSFVWGGLVLRTRRLVPAVLAHAVFSWAIVEFPIWRR